MSKKIELTFDENSDAFTPAPERLYVKKEFIKQEQVWSIYTESGERMGYAPSKEAAFAIVRQNEIVPLSVH